MTHKTIAVLFLLALLPVCTAPVAAETVAAGSQHSVVVTPDGRVWTWGSNSFGQLGDGTTTPHKTPVAIPTLTGVVAVAAGLNFTLALKSDGTVWAWGANTYGQLGINSTTQRTQPVQITSLTSVVAIAAGDNHSVALTSDGYVWVWGQNSNGQLGDGSTTISKVPKQVSTAPASSIAAGSSHTLIIKTDGTVWGMGANGTGQLGDGTTGTPRTSPVQMIGITSAVAAAGGNAHSLILLADGTLKAVGSNTYGQLGDSSNFQRTTAVPIVGLSGVQSVAAAQAHSYAVRNDGTMLSWGLDALGAGTTNVRNSPGQVLVVTNVAHAAAGQSHGIAVSIAGVVWTWGDNAGGQLGDGTTLDRSVPDAISGPNYLWKVATPAFSVAAGTYNAPVTVVVSCVTSGAEIHYTINGTDPALSDAVIASGSGVLVDRTATLKARAWLSGYPTSNVATADYVLKPVKPTITPNGGTFTTAQTVTMSTTTAGATIRYTTDGTSPLESSPLYTGPITIGTTTTLNAAAFRPDWTASITASATFQMNFGTLPAPTLAPSSGTYLGAAVVTMSSTVTGASIRYTTNGSTPTTASPLYTGPVAIGVSSTVSAKAFHPDYTASPTAAVTYTIVVEPPTLTPAAGAYSYGQIISASTPTQGATITYTLNGAAPSATDPVFPSEGIVAGNYTLKAAAWKTGATPSSVTTAVYQVTGTTSSAQIFGGGTHSFAIRPDGVVLAWGNNGSGQLGDGTTVSRSTPVIANGITGALGGAAGDSHSLGVLRSMAAAAWGANGGGRLGDGTTTPRSLPTSVTGLQSVTALAGGFLHSLALTSDGFVWAWGSNTSGQLGVADPSQQLVPIRIPTLANIVSIATRESSSFALAADGSVWSWGANANGQLATGDTTNRSVPGAIAGLSGVQAIAAGTSHTLALMADGTIQAWGLNSSGQVGDGTPTQRLFPVAVSSLTSVVAIAAGGTHSLALRQDGSVWAWGANSNGQVGDGSGINRLVPVRVDGLPIVVRISAGKNHSLALGVDGSVWAWGRNLERQLGDGTTTNALAPVCVIAAGTLAPTVAKPVFTPASGEYVGAVQVSLAASTPQSYITWTNDNSEPTESSTLYTNPIAVPAGSAVTIKAKAFRSGWAASETATATFTAFLGTVPTPVATPSSGSVDAYVAVKLTVADPLATIRYTTDGSQPTESSRLYSPYAAIIVRDTTTIKARAFRAWYAHSDVLTADYQIATAPIQVTVNDMPSPGIACVSPGATTTIAVANGPGDLGDWVGLYTAGAPHNEFIDWWYLNGAQDPPTSGQTSASINFVAPSEPGAYDVRFCHDDRYDCARRQATFMVAQSGTCVGIAAPHPGTTSVAVGSLPIQMRATALNGAVMLVSALDGATVIGSAVAAPYHVEWTAPLSAVHSLTARASLSAGGEVASSPVVFNVTDAQLRVNGTSPPSQLTVSAGATLSVAATSGMPFDASTRIGIYRVEDGDTTPLDWVYMNGSQTLPPSASTNPTVSIPAPNSAGVYQARLCAGIPPRCYVVSSLILVDTAFQMPASGTAEPMPLVWPTPGMYGPYQVISLVASSGSSIRFTLDGTSPDVSSSLYTAPFQITRSVQVRARAFPATGGIASDEQIAEYAIDNTDPIMSAVVTPAANSSGWNRTSVTVAFSCTDDQSGIAACSDPITISHDTAGDIVTGESKDILANASTLTVTVKIDTVAPVLSILSPASGTTLGVSEALIRGTVTDSLSGVASVTCNGVAAALAGTAFHCIVPLSGGGNEIAVVAADRAGNAVSALHTIYRSVIPVITSLDPNWGHVGQTVLVHGSNFGTTGSITISGQAAIVTDWTDTLITAQIPNGATTGPIVVTTAAGVSAGVNFTVTTGPAPTIGATLSPSTSTGGWYADNVTVTFTCTTETSTIVSCTPPVVVTDEGSENVVTGEAVDAAGNRASVSVVIKIDRSGPMLSIRDPKDGAIVPASATSVNISGTASDGGSGVQTVTCAGTPATLTAQQFSCTAPLTPGANSIEFIATDIVGHETRRTLSVTAGDVAPTTLEISPAQMLMIVGETRSLNLTDEHGRYFADATWSVDNEAAVHLTVTQESVTLRGVAPGTATLTVQRDGLSATAHITVLAAGTTPPAGTTLWALAERPFDATPPYGKVLPGSVPDGVNGTHAPSLFFIARYEFRTEIRATTPDGRQLWTYVHTEPPGTVSTSDDAHTDPFCCFRGLRGTLKHVAADEYGGLVLVRTQHWSPSTGNWYRTGDSSIVRLNGVTGSTDWEYQIPDSQLSDVAIRSDGTIFVVVTRRNRTELVGLDGQSGSVKYQVNLGYSEQSAWTKFPANVSAPVILTDDSVVVAVHRFVQRGFDRSNTLNIMGLTADDHGIDRSIWIDGIDPANLFPDLERLVPAGAGGLLLASVGKVFRIGTDNVLSTPLDIRIDEAPYFADEVEYVVADDAVNAMIHHQPTFYNPWEGSRLITFDPLTLAPLGSEYLMGSSRPHLDFSLDGGGVSWSWDATNAAQIAPAFSAGWQPAPLLFTAEPVRLGSQNWTGWSWIFPEGTPQGNNRIGRLHSNYNAIEITTSASLDEIFNAMATFSGVNFATDPVASVSGVPVTHEGQTLTFQVMPPLVVPSFDVKIVTFDQSDHRIVAETTRMHPLTGWRYWKVLRQSDASIRIETGALDEPTQSFWFGWFNLIGWYAGGPMQLHLWEQYLRGVVTNIQQTTPVWVLKDSLVTGKWDIMSAPYIKQQICAPDNRVKVCLPGTFGQ